MARPKVLGGFKMMNVGGVFFSTVPGLTLVVAVWAFSPPTTQEAALLSLSSNSNAPQEQSVSGKIASVEKTSFTLTVGQSQTQSLQQDPNTPKTMTFMIDKNTTIDGSLKVGASADVTYRQGKGSNVAVSRPVSP